MDGGDWGNVIGVVLVLVILVIAAVHNDGPDKPAAA